MTDSRPRPQYGEYATPEVQAKAMGLEWPKPAAPVTAHRAGVPATVPTAGRVPPPVASTVVSARPVGQANLIATLVLFVLLTLGLINVLVGADSYLDLPTTLQRLYDQFGFGTYTSTATAASLGAVAVVLGVIVWLLVAGLSVLLLRKRRAAWWVPLTGIVVFVVMLAVVTYVAIYSDPAFPAYLAKLTT